METQPKLLTPILKAFFGIIMLLVLKLITTEIPMFSGLSVYVNLVINILIILVLVNFNREFGRELRNRAPGFPESTSILNSIVLLVSVVLLYYALLPFATKYIYKFLWVYQLTFAILAIIPIYRAGMTIYTNIGKIAQLVSGKITEASVNTVECPQCKKKNPEGNKFCDNCGTSLQADTVSDKICPKCNANNSPSSKFCINCGTKL